MALSINTHSLLTTVASGTSTTGTLTASPGDLAILVCRITTAIPFPTVSGGGLNWVLALDKTVSLSRVVIFTAPVYSIVTAQTITITDTSTSGFKGALFAATNGMNLGNNNMLNNVGTTTMTLTVPTGRNGSLVLAMFNGSTDTVISAGSTQLDNNAADTATASANSSPFLAGTSVPMTATSAGGNIITGIAFEITGALYTRNNSGLRPHPFSPGLAR